MYNVANHKGYSIQSLYFKRFLQSDLSNNTFKNNIKSFMKIVVFV